MSRLSSSAIAIGVLLLAALGLTHAQLGTLDPPPGPIADTSPSLADIHAQLGGAPGTTSAWQVWTRPTAGNASDQLQSALIAPGRVHVRSVVAESALLTVFDGPGEIDTLGRVVSGSVVGRASNGAVNNTGVFGANQVFVDVVCENGAHAAWRTQNLIGGNSAARVIVYYRVLDETP
ncbi:MAG: hypothetical protein Tsb0013_25150 [Phycisphaerales bacterium]